jgi:hypothetical protein
MFYFNPRIHDRKLCVLGICTLISLGDGKPPVLSEVSDKIIPALILIFEGLNRAYAARAAEDEEEESEDDDDDCEGRQFHVKHQKRRFISNLFFQRAFPAMKTKSTKWVHLTLNVSLRWLRKRAAKRVSKSLPQFKTARMIVTVGSFSFILSEGFFICIVLFKMTTTMIRPMIWMKRRWKVSRHPSTMKTIPKLSMSILRSRRL